MEPMGLAKSLVGWIVVAAIVLAFGIVAATASGYLLIGDPVSAAGQLASGDVTPPNVTAENVRVTGADPSIGADPDATVEVRFDLVVNNTANAIGGSVDQVDYTVSLSDERKGPYQQVGRGDISDLAVPPGERVGQASDFEMGARDFATAMGSTIGGGDEDYVRVSGSASFAFGPFGIEVPFTQIRRVDYGA